MGYEVVLAQGVALEVEEIVGYLESIVGKSSGIAFMKAFAAKIELMSQFSRSIHNGQGPGSL